ncbi:MAG: acyl transferase [Bacteroidetes bacterium]|nr:MAG: acyl transferase [Bacteroidota bacterium]
MTEKDTFWQDQIFNVSEGDFLALAQQIFVHQLGHNPIYAQFVQALGRSGPITTVQEFPFLPIGFFKTHRVVSFKGEGQAVFTSSSTGGTGASSHVVKNLAVYKAAFMRGFERVYGPVQQYAVLCLLPSYMEREGSGLIYMAQALVAASGCADSGFFLQAKGELVHTLQRREAAGKRTLLLGVTFALLDFAAAYPMPLRHTVVMETGGMKGRKAEITRAEVHEELIQAFGLPAIAAEYGMTEMMSQAYAIADGLFTCPPWLRVLVRQQDDPLQVQNSGVGLLCIVDLANVHSCAFIETADLGRVYANGSFEVLGRVDHSDVRGCSLLAL